MKPMECWLYWSVLGVGVCRIGLAWPPPQRVLSQFRAVPVGWSEPPNG